MPDLVPIRYGRMLVSPFAFYRGGALIMAADLAAAPRSGLNVQACGDAHLSNFGVFGSPERRLMFDVNDFDETLPAPWEWDVKRLAASLVVAARENGYSKAQRREIVIGATSRYREAIRQFATMPNLAVWYSRLDIEEELAKVLKQLRAKQVKQTEQSLAKARTKDSMHAFAKLTHMVNGEPRIISDPPLLVPVEELLPEAADQMTEVVHEFIRGYRRSLQTDRRILLEQYRFVHLARKVVGVGSVGTRAWIALFMGLDGQDPLFLQVKEAQASVLEEFAGKSGYTNHGERVVAGQHLMQATSDIFLGWRRMANPIENVDARLLRAPAEGLEGLGRDRDDASERHGGLRTALRLDPGTRPRALRGPCRNRGLPGRRRQLRSSHRRVRGGLRRPERARPPGAGRRCEGRPRGG